MYLFDMLLTRNTVFVVIYLLILCSSHVIHAFPKSKNDDIENLAEIKRCLELSPNAPPIENLIPDVEFFNNISRIIKSYPYPLVMAVGRGTTGTRELTHIFEGGGWSTSHFTHVICQGEKKVGECLRHTVQDWKNELKVALEKRLDWNYLKQVQLKYVSRFFGCGACGPLVIGDNPWVSLFTEIFLSRCMIRRGIKVIFTTRNAKEWVTSRSEHHAGCATCFVCPKWKELNTPDPFSYIQCKPRNSVRGPLSTVSDANNNDKSLANFNSFPGIIEKIRNVNTKYMGQKELTDAFRQYYKLVQGLVPPESLLQFSLFSDYNMVNGPFKNMTSSQARVAWEGAIKSMVLNFID